ncbi:MAG TPA: isoamylase early set domain-containing protein [Acidimicrobiales bacterium]|nr:isoamylase early set domain-containing protein [Acidimicrobiales bacterium]
MPTKATAGPGRCRVTFRMNTSDGIDRAWVAGEFNGWSTDATPLERQTDGSLAADVVLETGKAYRYRFYLGRDRWENDWAADRYVDNDYGGADSVVVVPSGVDPRPRSGVDGPASALTPDDGDAG